MITVPPWLIVIDMQNVFARPESEWHVPDFVTIAQPAAELAEAFGDRVVATKFIAPAVPAGSWVPYYERWPAQLCERSSPDWDFAIPIAADTKVVVETTFNKWKDSLTALIPANAPLILCGVSTECCVLSTAVAAVDEGRQVSVVGDVCAGATWTLHDSAMHVLESYTPMIEMIDFAEAISRATTSDV